ncbi:hypothetical protein [Spirosoma gilvum]
MNQTFSISRFSRLFRKYFTDTRRTLLVNVGLLAGVLISLNVFFYSQSPRAVDDARYVIFFLVGWIGWYVFTVQQLTQLNQKEQAIAYLMQPASQFEKVLLVWLVSGLGFIVVYIALFTLLDAIGISFINHRDWAPENLAMMRRMGSLYELRPFLKEKSFDNVPEALWIFTALLHAFTMAFALIVRRNTLPLVIAIAGTLIMLSSLINNMLLHTLTGWTSINSKFPFLNAMAESPIDQDVYRTVNLPTALGNQLRYLVGIVIISLLYTTAYFRLKEREV